MLNIGRGSQSQTTTKPNNQNAQQKSAFPSLKSSFTKQQSSSEETEIASTNTNKLANKSDSESSDDGGSMARPSFALNPSTTTEQQQPEIQQQQQQQQTHNTFQSKSMANSSQQRRIADTGFIIYETLSQNDQQQSSINILQVSAAKQGATIKCDVEVGKSHPNTLDCVVRINDTVYGTATISTGKKEAKVQAFDNALQYARKIHYSIKVKLHLLDQFHRPKLNECSIFLCSFSKNHCILLALTLNKMGSLDQI